MIYDRLYTQLSCNPKSRVLRGIFPKLVVHIPNIENKIIIHNSAYIFTIFTSDHIPVYRIRDYSGILCLMPICYIIAKRMGHGRK